jgi:glycine/D-amino acid oxidase-like deaminating enzyme
MPGYGSRYWADRTAANRRRSYPTFRGQATADVVVIGGGLTGSAAAYALAASGLDVMLVEADRLANGSTAGSIGAIVPEPDAAYRAVERAVGRRSARSAWLEARRSAGEFASVLKKLPTRCDLQAASLLINAASGPDADLLRRERAARADAGLEAPLLTPTAAARELGTESHGALRLRPAFVFDPVRAALGLAAAAGSRGARIFEHSRVTRTQFTRKHAKITLPTGAIRARGVMVATGEPGDLFRQLRRHTRRLDGYAVVTASLSAAMRRDAGLRQGVLTEAGAAPHWLRWLTDDRVLFAGALARPVGPRLRDKAIIQRTAQLMYELSVRYPTFSGLSAGWGWDLPVVTTLDGLPWIGPHRNYPFHFFALALGWHGDGLAWHAARAAVRHFQGEPRREDETFGFSRHL